MLVSKKNIKFKQSVAPLHVEVKFSRVSDLAPHRSDRPPCDPGTVWGIYCKPGIVRPSFHPLWCPDGPKR